MQGTPDESSTSRSHPRSEPRLRSGRAHRWLRRALGAILLVATPACSGPENQSRGDAIGATNDGATPSAQNRKLADERDEMVEEQIEARGVRDQRVLSAMRKVPRHLFAPDVDPERAYADHPHPIGLGQTISQPYIVALMTELAELRPPCKVLEIGTGSGYQAAVLAELGCIVYTIEIVDELARSAAQVLAEAGYADRVSGRSGDGYQGWPEHAPFDAVLVTAAAPRVPQALLDQLRIGGRLVIPVGAPSQILEVHLRTQEGFVRESTIGVRFVPMTGEIRRSAD